VDSLVEQVRDRENITVHLNSEVIEDNGVMGNFRSTVRNNHTEETIEVEHGAVILATGGHEGRTTEYCHNESYRVVTQSEFENRLSKGEIDAAGLNNVVMIQCVGSREKGGREYCSRICCAGALKNAFKIREQNPETNIYVLNRDIMTYGYFEQYYTKARGEGVVFVKYDLDSKPTVEVVDDKTMVRFTDHVLQMDMEVAADQVILATGIEPSPGNVDLARVFGIDVNRDGFFVEADSKWRPVEFNKMGIFLAGTAHAPQSVNESLMQSEASAQKAYEYLSRKEIISPRVVSVVHDALCSRCQRCVEVCPYDARSYDEEKDRIVVDPAACQACGMCEATCPNNAAEVPGWNEKQTMTVIDDELRDETIPATL
jgi:heterodisulfide reductase subunit A